MSSVTQRRHTAKAAIDRPSVTARRIRRRRSARSVAFERLLRHVRRRPTSCARTGSAADVETKGQDEVLAGLLSLAAHHEDWLRPVETWEPAGGRTRFPSSRRWPSISWPVTPSRRS